jgi:hypothetical protein
LHNSDIIFYKGRNKFKENKTNFEAFDEIHRFRINYEAMDFVIIFQEIIAPRCEGGVLLRTQKRLMIAYFEILRRY